MNQGNERLYVPTSERGFLRITESGCYPLYRSENGEFEMEHDERYGWTLYAVIPRNGRVTLGQNPFRTILAEEYNLTLEAMQ